MKSIYVNNGAFLFKNREDLTKAVNLIFSHFKRLGLIMYTSNYGSYKDSKIEVVYFEAPNKKQSKVNASPATVNRGYTFFSKTFTHITSKLSHYLNNGPDIEARQIQATRAVGVMTKNIFHNPHLTLHIKWMLYLEIPVNLLL